MIYLILAIATSVTFSATLKIAERGGRNRIVVAFANYVAGAVLASLYVFAFTRVRIPASTVYIGIIAGAAWVAGVITLMLAIREVGLAYSAAFARLSVLLAVLACVVFWRESLSVLQVTGIALVCIAIFALSTRAVKREGRFTIRGTALLAGLFCAQGFVQIVQKVFQSVSPKSGTANVTEYVPQVIAYMMILFATASVLTGIWMAQSRRKIKRGDLFFGAAIGVPNMLTGILLILALDAIPGSVVFSVWNGASVLLLALLGVAVWRERLGARGATGIALAVIALVLINLR